MLIKHGDTAPPSQSLPAHAYPFAGSTPSAPGSTAGVASYAEFAEQKYQLVECARSSSGRSVHITLQVP